MTDIAADLVSKSDSQPWEMREGEATIRPSSLLPSESSGSGPLSLHLDDTPLERSWFPREVDSTFAGVLRVENPSHAWRGEVIKERPTHKGRVRADASLRSAFPFQRHNTLSLSPLSAVTCLGL